MYEKVDENLKETRQRSGAIERRSAGITARSILLLQHRTAPRWCPRGAGATCVSLLLALWGSDCSPTLYKVLQHTPQSSGRRVSSPFSAAGDSRSGAALSSLLVTSAALRLSPGSSRSPSPEQTLQRSSVLLPLPPPTFSLVSANDNNGLHHKEKAAASEASSLTIRHHTHKLTRIQTCVPFLYSS